MSWSKTIETHSRDAARDLDAASEAEIAGHEPTAAEENQIRAAKRAASELLDASALAEGPLVIELSGDSDAAATDRVGAGVVNVAVRNRKG